MTHRYVAALLLFTAACLTAPDDGADVPTAGRPAAAGPALVDADTVRLIVVEAEADACVEDGCPTGQVCDWILGCTDEVTFCCADEQCGEGRFCDFDAGGVCTPRG